MNFKSKKIIFGFLVFGGTLIALSPFIIATVMSDDSIVRNNSISYPLILTGMAMVIVGSFIAKSFRCPHCNNKLMSHNGGVTGTYTGGVIGIVSVLKLKQCPICDKELTINNKAV